jgi:IS30 family transposase
LGYGQLSMEEREVIMIRLNQGKSARAIARQLGRAPSTISREIRRSGPPQKYRAQRAQARALKCRHVVRKPKKLDYEPLRQYVDRQLRAYWSPEQIAGRLKRKSVKPRMRVSHETIYRFILEAAAQGVDYEKYLRQGHRRHTYGYRGKAKYHRIRDAKSIEQRPAVVDRKKRVGDWEMDTLRGAARSAAGVATCVERKTNYLVMAKVNSRKAAAYNRATARAFARQAGLPLRTMTTDRGMEFAEFEELERWLGVRVYFAHSYHAWERGLNENTNGLLRQFFPKGRDFGKVSSQQIHRVGKLINNRPRKALKYRTPVEALKARSVALVS